jgi:hypothetical protein
MPENELSPSIKAVMDRWERMSDGSLKLKVNPNLHPTERLEPASEINWDKIPSLKNRGFDR